MAALGIRLRCVSCAKTVIFFHANVSTDEQSMPGWQTIMRDRVQFRPSIRVSPPIPLRWPGKAHRSDSRREESNLNGPQAVRHPDHLFEGRGRSFHDGFGTRHLDVNVAAFRVFQNRAAERVSAVAWSGRRAFRC